MTTSILKNLATIGISALLLQGCTTAYLLKEANHTKPNLEYDNIQYMASMVNADGTRDTKNLLMLGEKYTYKISSHDKKMNAISDLEKIAEIIDVKYLQSKPLELKFHNHALTQNPPYSVVYFVFSYDKQNQLLTDNEKHVLGDYCKQKTDTAYTGCYMKFGVELYDKMTPTAQQMPLKGKYPIQLTLGYKEYTDARIALLPLSVATDIVTSPLQLLSVVIIVGSLATIK